MIKKTCLNCLCYTASKPYNCEGVRDNPEADQSDCIDGHWLDEKETRERWAMEWQREIHGAITAMGNLIRIGDRQELGKEDRRFWTDLSDLIHDETSLIYRLNQIAESDQPLPDLTDESWRKDIE